MDLFWPDPFFLLTKPDPLYSNSIREPIVHVVGPAAAVDIVGVPYIMLIFVDLQMGHNAVDTQYHFRGEELLVLYGYDLDYCPDWYKDAWENCKYRSIHV